MGVFDKPIYDLPSALHDLGKAALAVPDLARAVAGGRVSAAEREQVMLACTAVNRCRYCGFVHAHWAWLAGVKPERIKALLQEQVSALFGEDEEPALLFARHFAQTRGEPTAGQLSTLRETYGPERARDILAFLRVIFFANVAGNTFDAFLARFSGDKAPDSSLLFEWVFAQFAGPILLPVLMALKIRKFLPDGGPNLMQAIPA